MVAFHFRRVAVKGLTQPIPLLNKMRAHLSTKIYMNFPRSLSHSLTHSLTHLLPLTLTQLRILTTGALIQPLTTTHHHRRRFLLRPLHSLLFSLLFSSPSSLRISSCMHHTTTRCHLQYPLSTSSSNSPIFHYFTF